MKIVLGTDPELFLIDKEAKTQNRFVSAHNLVPGTKTEPYKINSGAIQADGTSVEFNTKPASSGKEFHDNVMEALLEIRKMVPSRYEFAFKPAIKYPKKYFDALPEKVRELGCDPDFVAGTGLVSEAPVRPSNNQTLCTGSGHLHVGWTSGKDVADPEHFADARVVANGMYTFYSRVKHLWDSDTARHQLYGWQGQFRPKSYGVESRFLSNAWLNYPKLWPWLFDTTQKIVDDLETNGRVRSVSYWAARISDVNNELHYNGYPTIPADYQSNVLKL